MSAANAVVYPVLLGLFLVGLFYIGPRISDKAITQFSLLYRLQNRLHISRADLRNESALVSLSIFLFLFQRPVFPVRLGKLTVLRGVFSGNQAVALRASFESEMKAKRQQGFRGQSLQLPQKIVHKSDSFFLPNVEYP